MPSDRRHLWQRSRPSANGRIRLALAGRMNARTAARAETRLQEMDRLATTRDRRERDDHRLRGHHATADPEGHRYRCHPDRVDRDSARAYRAGRDLRALSVLYADPLRFFCTANDRQETRALSHRSTLQLHVLFDRP